MEAVKQVTNEQTSHMLATVAEKLGSNKVAIRIAGLYALETDRSFAVVQSAIVLADRGLVAPATVTEIGDDLLELFRWVSDGRSDQGRDHPVAAVLAPAAAAVVAGMKGYTAISGWVKDVPPLVLADLYMRAGARRRGRRRRRRSGG